MDFFNNAVSQVGAQTELRVGRRTVQTQRRLAEGGFGVVDLVIDAYSKQELVLKRCNIDRPESFEIARKEINMLQKYKGPYIVELLESDILQKSKTSREALLLMEYYPGDHLLGRLLARNGSYLPQDTIFRMFGQLCLALKDMHLSRPPIVHRDIKLENVLFGTDGKVRLCDFGSCVESPIMVRNAEERQDAEEHIQKETTQMYRAPEMVDLYLRPTITEKTDIWAMGCMLYAMCFLIHPFQDGSTLGILNAKIHFPNDSPFNPDTTHALILRMLDIDPECRPDIVELIQWVSAVSSGQPLPAQELSAEAQQCRANRIAADQIRETKANSKLAKQKAAQAKPGPKKHVQLSANSVAARRLATMRGQPLPEDDHHQNQGEQESPDSFGSSSYYHDNSPVETFDPFGASAGPSAFPAAATSAPPRASFGTASFAPSSGANAAGSFAAFDDGAAAANSFDPFGASTSASAPVASFDAFGAAPTASAFASASISDGFSNFDSHEAPSFDAFATPAGGGFDAFDDGAAHDAGSADSGFAPTSAAPAAAASVVAGFDNFDEEATSAPTSSTPFDTFSPAAAENPFDSFAPTSNTHDAFAPTSQAAENNLSSFDPFADDSYAPASDGFAATSAFESAAPEPVVDFFVTTEEAPAPAPARAAKRASAASLLFQSFQDDEEPPVAPLPASMSIFVDPPAFLAPAPLLAPTPAKAPAAPALIDIFNDDLISPAPSAAQLASAPPSVNGKRNPLDVLSLYDAPPAPVVKNAMTGTGMSAAASISNIGMGPAGPMGGMNGMGGMGMSGKGPQGFPGSPPGQMGGMPRGMPVMAGPGPGPMQGGGMMMMMMQGGMQPRPMAPAVGMGGSPMAMGMGGMGAGRGPAPVSGGMGMGAGRPAYQSGAISTRAPADPFNAINVLKK